MTFMPLRIRPAYRLALFLILALLISGNNIFAAVLGNIGTIALLRARMDQTGSASGINGMSSTALDLAAQLSAPSSRWAHGLARVAMLNADPGRAKDLLTQVSLARPDDILIGLDLGSVYASLGDRDSAMRAWQKAGADRPILALASQIRQQEGVKKALPIYEVAVRANPKSALAWREVGRARYETRSDLPAAASALQQAMRLDPYDSWAGQILGNIYLEWRAYDLALEWAAQMEERFPNSVVGLVLKGDALYGIGRPREAEQAYIDAIGRDPRLPGLYERLADLYDREKQYARAVENWKHAVALEPGRWTYRMQLAESYLATGDKTSAVAEYREALKLNPGNTELEHIIRGLVGSGDTRQ